MAFLGPCPVETNHDHILVNHSYNTTFQFSENLCLVFLSSLIPEKPSGLHSRKGKGKTKFEENEI